MKVRCNKAITKSCTRKDCIHFFEHTPISCFGHQCTIPGECEMLGVDSVCCVENWNDPDDLENEA